MDLEAWRKQIDALNTQLVDLLNERARCALGIMELKRQLGLPVHDPVREQQVLDKVSSHSSGPLSDQALHRIFQCIMEEHRKLEENG